MKSFNISRKRIWLPIDYLIAFNHVWKLKKKLKLYADVEIALQIFFTCMLSIQPCYYFGVYLPSPRYVIEGVRLERVLTWSSKGFGVTWSSYNELKDVDTILCICWSELLWVSEAGWTLYPKICLSQCSTGRSSLIISPLSQDLRVTPRTLNPSKLFAL